jgi:hypothetical protein
MANPLCLVILFFSRKQPFLDSLPPAALLGVKYSEGRVFYLEKEVPLLIPGCFLQELEVRLESMCLPWLVPGSKG